MLFDSPTNDIGEVNTEESEWNPWLSPDGAFLYFTRGPERSSKLLVAARDGQEPIFGAPVDIGAALGAPTFHGFCVSSDGLTLFWGDGNGSEAQSPKGHGFADVWVARRSHVVDERGNPVSFELPAVNLGRPVNTGAWDSVPRITADWPATGSRLYFTRCVFGPCDILEALWHPDCNGNGSDDLEDIASRASLDKDGDGVPDECEDG